jgi:hypothetical protein
MFFEVFRNAWAASCTGSVSFRRLIAGLLSSRKIVGTFRHASVRTAQLARSDSTYPSTNCVAAMRALLCGSVTQPKQFVEPVRSYEAASISMV